MRFFSFDTMTAAGASFRPRLHARHWRVTGLQCRRASYGSKEHKTKTETTVLVSHQEIFDRAVFHVSKQGRAGLLQHAGDAYCGHAGWGPVGKLIRPRDDSTTIEGVPVRLLAKAVASAALFTSTSFSSMLE